MFDPFLLAVVFAIGGLNKNIELICLSSLIYAFLLIVFFCLETGTATINYEPVMVILQIIICVVLAGIGFFHKYM